MADGFIVRKGGVAIERTTAPSINFVSKSITEIVVTLTNNDAAEAEIYYGITSTLTDTVTLAAAATSNNITFSGFTQNTAVTVSAYALVTDPTSKKIKSEIVSTVITTDAITFTAATGGTTLEYDSGGKRFKSHTFLEDGNFVVTTVGNATDDRNKVDYLIIAGGGGGGDLRRGGGGAGGYRTTDGTSGGPNPTTENKFTVTATTFGIEVGAGGSTTINNGVSGSNSVALGITSIGGGGGGGGNDFPALNGGSGGGGAGDADGIRKPGGLGTSGQGFAGGQSNPSTVGGWRAGGGGGGAGAVGADASNTSGNNTTHTPGNGGNGLFNTLRDGTSETRAGGGSGTGINANGTNLAGTGGSGGGGNSGNNGTANTGSGGGAGIGSDGGSGGLGIVVIRYEIAPSV